MQIKEVEFIKSSAKVEQCPQDGLPEYAFLGRSNVGKSSLINYLTNKKRIAKTSGKPGHTQLINHFLVDNSWYLVDLPGYGYARIGKQKRKEFAKIITDYVSQRMGLTCLFQLIDCRHDPMEIDMNFMTWLGENQIPFAICFTKTDKLSKNQLEAQFKKYKEELLKTWEELPQIFTTSVLNRTGAEDILDFINSANKMVNNTGKN